MMIASNPDLTIPEIAQLLSVSDTTIKRTIRSLKQKQYIKHDGSNKDGKWVVLK